MLDTVRVSVVNKFLKNGVRFAKMVLKIFDTRALEHPRPLEIMSEALKFAHLGEILLMIHRREPLPLYDIIRAQGLEFRALEVDFNGEFIVNFASENLQEMLENLQNFSENSAQNLSKNSQNFSEFLLSNLNENSQPNSTLNLNENLHLNSIFKSLQNNDFSIEFALFDENDENNNSLNFTCDFCLKSSNFTNLNLEQNSAQNLSENSQNLDKKQSQNSAQNSQNLNQNSNIKFFFIFIAKAQILNAFDIENFTQILTQNSVNLSKKFANLGKNSTNLSENSAPQREQKMEQS